MLVAAVNIVVGVVKLATGNVTGILNIISGICTLVGAIFSEQLAGAMGTATLGVQTIMIGVQSLSCNPVYGIIAMAVGAACVAFATAEAQESLGYGNWLKDTVGMSDEVYKGVMVAVNVAAIAINIVGVKQCFKEGTLVACLNENGDEVRKPIETVAVGTLLLRNIDFLADFDGFIAYTANVLLKIFGFAVRLLIFISINCSSLDTLSIFNPRLIRSAENCHFFSKSPKESIMIEISFSG